MAQSKGSKGNRGNQGFGSMEDSKLRELSSKGGQASAQHGDTSNRGFASMDKEKQRDISGQGGRSSQEKQGSLSQNVKRLTNAEIEEVTEKTTAEEEIAGDAHFKSEGRAEDIAGEIETSERDLNSLEEEDEVVESKRGQATYSETDENEDEGLGDGNIGRSRN